MAGTEARAECFLEGVDRRGRKLRCRVRIGPLTFADRSRHGAVLVIEDVTADAQGQAPEGERSGSNSR
jgi:two-component system CheB/CheR fusion protein